MDRYLKSNDKFTLNGISGEFVIREIVGRGSSCVVYRTDFYNPEGIQTEHLVKEYNPKDIALVRNEKGTLVVENESDQAAFEAGLVWFEDGLNKQRELRSGEKLRNYTANIQNTYRDHGTLYVDMTVRSGKNYEGYKEASVYNLMKRMRTLTQVVGHYHAAGYLHLDLKPANIYVRPDDETCEDVLLFDFDSMVKTEDISKGIGLSYTQEWAALEQMVPNRRSKIGAWTDFFAIGEMIFVQLMGRHSESWERCAFAEYDFDFSRPILANVNPKVKPLLTELLQKTICNTASQRFQTADEMIVKLDEILIISHPDKPYLKGSPLNLQSFFDGRKNEIHRIHELLNENRILFLNGIGGIGKSELAKHYAQDHKKDYDVIIFAPCSSNIQMMLQSDTIPLVNFYRYQDETAEEYCTRKLKVLGNLCDERVLLIVDNLNDENDPYITSLFNLGCKLLITTRVDFSEIYPGIERFKLGPLDSPITLFNKHYMKTLSEEEFRCVHSIIERICGHTMTVELLAKQMRAGRITPQKMLQRLEAGGIRESGKERVWHANFKGDISKENTYDHIRMLFDLSGLCEDEKHVLANLSLIPYTGVAAKLFYKWCELESYETINTLSIQGWISWDERTDSISLHPVIADVIKTIVNTEIIDTMLINFCKELTDDETGEVILSAIPFSLANSISIIILQNIQCGQIDPTEEVVHCIVKIGDFFFEQSLFELAETSYCLANENYEEKRLADNYLWISIHNSLALLYDKQGELLDRPELSEKALGLFERCLEIAMNPANGFGEHISTFYGNIGSVYHSLKNYVKAEAYYKKALENGARCSFYTDLGVLYENKGEYTQALKMHKAALDKASDCDEPPLVIALIEHNMAVSYKRLDQLGEAFEHCDRALKIRENSFESVHSYDLALSQSLMGQICIEIGSECLLEKAEILLRKALVSFEKVVGAKHTEYKKVLTYLDVVETK